MNASLCYIKKLKVCNNRGMSDQYQIALLIHGGAGAIQDAEIYRESMTAIIEHGKALLLEGKNALDTVESCVTLLEDDARYNAGRGSVLNDQGGVEMDAGIMDGSTMRSGAVAGIRNIKNPIRLARKVMERTAHVLLMGDGALQFAKAEGVAMETDEYFMTPLRQGKNIPVGLWP
jgi:beta-aspartyl-peptidase (threonine type)